MRERVKVLRKVGVGPFRAEAFFNSRSNLKYIPPGRTEHSWRHLGGHDTRREDQKECPYPSSLEQTPQKAPELLPGP